MDQQRAAETSRSIEAISHEPSAMGWIEYPDGQDRPGRG
jgi:hypothetical protein